MELAVTERIASEFTGRIPLPVAPHLLERLLHTLQTPMVEPAQLAHLIEMDPVLCYRSMQLDHGMHPEGPPAEPFSIHAVIGRIGLSGANAIICQALVDQTFDAILHRQALALTWLWRHALTTALISSALTREMDAGSPDQAYLAGLWHTIGNLALAGRTPEACLPMLSDPIQALPLLEAESRVVGGRHHHIAATIIHRHTHAWWAADTIRSHHLSDDQARHAFLPSQVLWAANRLAETPHPSQDAYRTVSALLPIDMARLTRLVSTCTQQAGEAANNHGKAPLPTDAGTGIDIQASSLNRQIRIRTILSHVNAQLVKAPDKRAIIGVLHQGLSIFMGIDAMIVFEQERQSGLLSGIFSAGCTVPLSPSALRIHPAASECLPARCRSRGATMDSFARSAHASLTMIDRQLIRYTGGDGIICTPMNPGDDGPWACLVLGVHSGYWPWVSRHTDLLQAIVAAVVEALKSKSRYGKPDIRRAADSDSSDTRRIRRIVHEINNPLSIIKNYLNVLNTRDGDRPMDPNALDIIDGEINRVAELVRSLTRSSDASSAKRESLDLNATIMETLALFGNRIEHEPSVHLIHDLDERILPIVSDGDRLKQALINLLKNAMEAIPDGGSIRVRTRLLNTVLANEDSPAYEQTIRISVCDDGPGIDDQVKNDLFKSHVTSKNGHDGLGLPIVMEMVNHLNGILRIENTPSRGTCFHIELPAGEDSPAPSQIGELPFSDGH